MTKPKPQDKDRLARMWFLIAMLFFTLGFGFICLFLSITPFS